MKKVKTFLLIAILVFQLVFVSSSLGFDEQIIDDSQLQPDCPGDKSWRIRTHDWTHENEEATCVKLHGFLGLMYFMSNYYLGFVWDTVSHEEPEDYANYLAADDFGPLHSFRAVLDGLDRETTYYFRAIGEYISSGIIYEGSEIEFKPGNLKLDIHEATEIGEYTATLNGELTHMGGASSCEVWFEYGTDPENLNMESEPTTMDAIGSFSHSVSGLRRGANHYFRAVGSNDCGEVKHWEILNFTAAGELDNTAPDSPEPPQSEEDYGSPNRTYYFTTSALDPDSDKVRFGWDWGDGSVMQWTELYSSGEVISMGHTWNRTGSFEISVIAEDFYGLQSSPTVVEFAVTTAPQRPTISGPEEGSKGVEYTYQLSSADPEGDELCYLIDWGDDNTETSEFFDSGTTVGLSHTWSEEGEFFVMVKAIDCYGAESDWAYLSVTMPRVIENPWLVFFNTMLNWLSENFFWWM